MAVALKGIGDEGKRHGEHGSPSATYEQEGKHEQILVADERHKSEAYATDYKANGKAIFSFLNFGRAIAHSTEPMACQKNSTPTQLPAS